MARAESRTPRRNAAPAEPLQCRDTRLTVTIGLRKIDWRSNMPLALPCPRNGRPNQSNECHWLCQSRLDTVRRNWTGRGRMRLATGFAAITLVVASSAAAFEAPPEGTVAPFLG